MSNEPFVFSTVELNEKTFSIVWNSSTYDDTEMIHSYEDHTLIWLDKQPLVTNTKLINCLSTIINHIERIECLDSCIDYLSSVNKDTQQIFLVICGIFPSIDLREVLDLVSELNGFVYLWCSKAEMDPTYPVRGIFSNEQDLITKLASDFHHVKGNKFNGMSTHHFNVNQIRFKCFHLLMEVLHRLPSPREIAKETMIKYCVLHSRTNLDEKVEEFRTRYVGDNAITWYSRHSFFKKHFDRDLRRTDFNLISNFSFFLTDLYDALHKKFQASSTESNDFIVYRGLRLSNCELQELNENVGSLISNNTFLSTTSHENIALSYATINNDQTPDQQSVLFIVHVNSKNTQHPYANISDVTNIEGEILISIGTVFRIDSVCEPQSSNSTSLNTWTISLTMCEKRPLLLDDYFDIVFLRLTEILRRMSPDSDKVNMQILERCRLYYSHDVGELQKIDDFENNYTTDQAFRWYAKDSFLFRILNTALRRKDVKTIIDLRFFILNLHDQLIKTQIEYIRTLPIDTTQQIKLYRGQLMSQMELAKLQKSIGNYISITSFFSTSTSEQVALIYSGADSDYSLSPFESVVFVININLNQILNGDKSIPRVLFARMNSFSQFQDEEEVLLSNHNIFYLNRIEKRLDYTAWSIYLTVCIEDQHLDNAHQYIDIILSPVVHLNLNYNNPSFALQNIVCLNSQRTRESSL